MRSFVSAVYSLTDHRFYFSPGMGRISLGQEKGHCIRFAYGPLFRLIR